MPEILILYQLEFRIVKLELCPENSQVCLKDKLGLFLLFYLANSPAVSLLELFNSILYLTVHTDDNR